MTAGETRETVQREVPNGDMTLCGNWAGMRTVSLDRRHLMQRTIRKGICAGAFSARCVNSSPSAAAPSPCSHLPSRSLLQILSTVLSSPYIRKQSSQAVPTPGACSTNASRKNTEKNSLTINEIFSLYFLLLDRSRASHTLCARAASSAFLLLFQGADVLVEARMPTYL